MRALLMLFLVFLPLVACSEPPSTGDRERPLLDSHSNAVECASLEELWAIGVRELEWDPEAMPDDASEDMIREWLVQDLRIKDWGDHGYAEDPNLRIKDWGDYGYAEDPSR